MVKFTSQQIVEYATRLADLQNSSFITWGDNFTLLNASYRKVYQDLIDMGELSYLKEVELLAYGTCVFSLPDDFYQLAVITNEYGDEIPRSRLANDRTSIGYEIKNNTIKLYNCRSRVILKYYPLPETITMKKERSAEIEIGGTPMSGFGTEVYCANGDIYDVAQQQRVYTTQANLTYPLLGKIAVVDAKTGYAYYKSAASVIDNIIRPMLTTDGSFISNTWETVGLFGWCNEDASARFMITEGGSVYYNGKDLKYTTTVRPSGRCIWWNGKWALVLNDVILYEDGTWETHDTKSVVCLLKCDTDTGYGFLVKGRWVLYFAVEGWTPNTVIDYPNNILFDLTAYDLAISYRMKQNSDSSALQAAYNQKEKTYFASLSNDEAYYTTIRNVDGRFFRGMY